MKEPIEKYRPSNGTEGDCFRAQWCDKCAKDANHDCRILARTMAYSVTDKEYPSEWIYDAEDNPICTAFSSGAL